MIAPRGGKVVAGEFSDFNGIYVKQYIEDIVKPPYCKNSCRHMLPTIWGLHDYHDVVEGNKLNAIEMARQLRKIALHNPMLWTSEAGVLLEPHIGHTRVLVGNEAFQKSCAGRLRAPL